MNAVIQVADRQMRQGTNKHRHAEPESARHKKAVVVQETEK